MSFNLPLGNFFCNNLTISSAAPASLGAFTSLHIKGNISICGKCFNVKYVADDESQPPDNDTTTCLGKKSSSKSTSFNAISLCGDFITSSFIFQKSIV